MNRWLSTSRTLVTGVILAWLTVPALSQSNLGTVTGVVTDELGAVVPGVEIIITNRDTGIATRTRANADGVYLAPSLIFGPYRIEAKAQGFKSLGQQVTLQAGQTLRLDVKLAPGEVSETVEVTGAAPLLNRESAEISATITAAEVQSLPLKDRSPYGSVVLMAGISTENDDPAGPGSRFAVNGSRALNSTLVIDGANLQSVNGIGERVSSVEALQEVKVLTSGYSAEYAQVGGGGFFFQVKSGTKQYHGSGYWFRQDAALNAVNWRLNAVANSVKPKDANDEFGGTFGGPVPLAGKKMFFFASYEHQYPRNAVVHTRTIADTRMRAGDFSHLAGVTIRDPQNDNQPFPGNKIPANRFDPAAVKLLALLPPPNQFETFQPNNYVRSETSAQRRNLYTSRVDYTPNDRQKLFFTLGTVKENITNVAEDFESPLNTIGAVEGGRDRVIWRGTLAYNHVFSTTFFNETLTAIARDHRVVTPRFLDFDVTKEPGIQRRVGRGLPTLTFAGSLSNFGNSLISDGFNQSWNVHNISTLLRGRHSLRFGAQWAQTQEPYFESNNLNGSYSFNGEITGGRNIAANAFADFLLGAVKTASVSQPQLPANRINHDFGLFLQDDWKLTPRITLNLGMRYEFETLPTERNDIFSRIDPATGQLLVAGRNASRNLNRQTDYNNFAPRLGVAWSPGGKTVVRSGFAMIYLNTYRDFGARLDYTGFRLAQNFNDLGAGRAQAFRFFEGFPTDKLSGVADPLALFAAATPTATGALVVAGPTFNTADPRPYLLNWNLGVQRTIPFNTVVELAYVGSRGIHLPRQRAINNPGLDKIAAVAAARAVLPEHRRYPQLSAFNATYYDAFSDYHSLQVRATRRFQAGFSLQSNYTFSKSLDDASNGFDKTGGISDAQI
ncbi:MAG: TonB-dependent receptor domain-containing protein, partial [Blastocatellia bacterium]